MKFDLTASISFCLLSILIFNFSNSFSFNCNCFLISSISSKSVFLSLFKLSKDSNMPALCPLIKLSIFDSSVSIMLFSCSKFVLRNSNFSFNFSNLIFSPSCLAISLLLKFSIFSSNFFLRILYPEETSFISNNKLLFIWISFFFISINEFVSCSIFEYISFDLFLISFILFSILSAFS